MAGNEWAYFPAGDVVREVEQQYRTWFEDNPLPMWVFDPETFAFLEVNDAAVRHYGYTRAEFRSMTILDIRPVEDVPGLRSRIQAGFPGRTQKILSRHRTKAGHLIEVEIYAQQVPWNGRRAEIIQIHDISELKRAEEALRDLSGRLLQMQDVQKRRMARELHDAVGQTVTALLLKLALVRRAAAASSDPEAEGTVGECAALARQMLEEIRTVSYLLHPPLLDEEGIRAALDLYVEGFAERSGIHVDLAIPGDVGRFPEELEITLFRVVQEALTNVHRHAESTSAEVHLFRDASTLLLEIRDRGKGMPAEILERVRRGAIAGVGIAGMRERVAQLGGRLAIDSSGEGSVIRVAFPLEGRDRR